jgi:ADP-glucose pyrophosphorylase
MRTAEATPHRRMADVIYKNIYFIEETEEQLAFFGGDHVYRANVSKRVEFDEEKHSKVTVATCPCDLKFGSDKPRRR